MKLNFDWKLKKFKYRNMVTTNIGQNTQYNLCNEKTFQNKATKLIFVRIFAVIVFCILLHTSGTNNSSFICIIKCI